MAKSAIGSAFGFVSTITTRIIGAVKLRQAEEAILGLSEDTIKRLTDEFVLKLIDAAVGVAENCYKVVVNYGQSLKEMIVAGKYDWANEDINADHFPIQGSGQQDVVIELVHYGRNMSTDDVLKDLESKGMRPAILLELLAFGVTYPEKQREFPIFALGSVWQDSSGFRSVPCLIGGGSERGLFLGWSDGGWSGGCRFAAVRK
jgi:hypothetical protein